MRIGIDLGGTKIEGAALAGPDDDILWRRRVATPPGDYPATVAAIADLVAEIERELGRSGTVGIATPGAVSRQTCLMKNCNSTCLNGRPLARDIEDALGREVRTANDADCLAISEALDGAGRGARVVFGVILGTGVGGGLAIDGLPIQGPNGITGEWGHTPMPASAIHGASARPCYCGLDNCVETFLSGGALAATHIEQGGAQVAGPAVVDRAAIGEPAALRAMELHYERLAAALAVVLNVLDPDVIVLGGGLSVIEAIYEEVPRRWGAYVFSDTVATPLLAARYGDSSGVRGAARLWAKTEPAAGA